jgi:hypothetical protein
VQGKDFPSRAQEQYSQGYRLGRTLLYRHREVERIANRFLAALRLSNEQLAIFAFSL